MRPFLYTISLYQIQFFKLVEIDQFKTNYSKRSNVEHII